MASHMSAVAQPLVRSIHLWFSYTPRTFRVDFYCSQQFPTDSMRLYYLLHIIPVNYIVCFLQIHESYIKISTYPQVFFPHFQLKHLINTTFSTSKAVLFVLSLALCLLNNSFIQYSSRQFFWCAKEILSSIISAAPFNPYTFSQ